MSPEPAVSISYFSDVLCVWAYFAQIKLDQIRQDFGPQVKLRHHFISVFGDVEGKIGGGWKERGGMEGYRRHVHQLAERFSHASIHPEAWKTQVPASSASCHLLLKAAQLLESAGEISSDPMREHGGNTPVEELIWRLRCAFFRDARDVCSPKIQAEITGELGIQMGPLRSEMDDGRAFAALFADAELQKQHLIQGSPTFLLNEGRQKLYGNVGYRVIRANLEELLEGPEELASWC
jgi:predicted DsbA family dithiol-disulfide isomerase